VPRNARLEVKTASPEERWAGERFHELDPEPLRELDDWLAPYAAAWDERLARLRDYLEEP